VVRFLGAGLPASMHSRHRLWFGCSATKRLPHAGHVLSRHSAAKVACARSVMAMAVRSDSASWYGMCWWQMVEC